MPSNRTFLDSAKDQLAYLEDNAVWIEDARDREQAQLLEIAIALVKSLIEELERNTSAVDQQLEQAKQKLFSGMLAAGVGARDIGRLNVDMAEMLVAIAAKLQS